MNLTPDELDKVVSEGQVSKPHFVLEIHDAVMGMKSAPVGPHVVLEIQDATMVIKSSMESQEGDKDNGKSST